VANGRQDAARGINQDAALRRAWLDYEQRGEAAFFSLINMPSAKWMRSESEIWPLLLGSDSGMLIRVYAR
jgi:hypothetical protein